MTNTFFYTEGNVFQTEEEAKTFLGGIKGKIEAVDTENSFDAFEKAFLDCKHDGDDDATALAFAGLKGF